MTYDKSLEKDLALVQTLYERTRAGAVEWQETSDRRGFETRLANFELRLQMIPDQNYPDDPDYELLVIDVSSGTEIERISNTSLRPVMDQKTEDGLTPYKLLVRTYEMARRQALRVDDALETILEKLAKV
jgi:hypothetical protein